MVWYIEYFLIWLIFKLFFEKIRDFLLDYLFGCIDLGCKCAAMYYGMVCVMSLW